MSVNRRIKVKEVVRNMGFRSILLSMLVFMITIGITIVVGYQFYNTTKDSIRLQGKINAVQSAKEFDGYLLVRKNTVVLASHVVDEMLMAGRSNSDILEYLSQESLSIKLTIDKDYTGLYGWINGEYCDGDGWIPEEGYIPTERPWYLETISDSNDITFVKPYVDAQTGTVLTTVSKKLSDGTSVLALDITLSRVQEIAEEISHRTPGSCGIVVDDTGQVIAHSDKTELGKNYLEETGTLGAAVAEKLFHDGIRQFELVFRGQKYMVFSETIGEDWLSVSIINTRYFYRPLVIILSLLALFMLLEAIIFVMVLYNQSAKNLAVASAEEAQSANRAKTLFLSRMSHEIRTPINAIIGLDTLALYDETIPSHTREELNKIGASARHLLSIVNDILDMSRIESGRVVLKEEIFSLGDFLTQIQIIVDGQCQEKGLRFICNKVEPLDAFFYGDNLKLKQVIINILGNSVKFTDAPGEITFTVEQTASTDERCTLQFTMSDTGIGMDQAYLPKLFEAFSQEDTNNTSRYGGSGLGMAISKSFVSRMGGDIRVQSEKGQGTTFTVSVPLGRVSEPETPEGVAQEAPTEEYSLAGMHVLIVEDQEMNAEILADLLEIEDVSTEWAENGQRAIEVFSQSEKGQFDAILMDMRMPVMDGLTATREIRKLSHPDAAAVPIIALTANAFEEDVNRCLEAGMNAHLAKPVDIDLLKGTLKRLISSDQ